MVCNHNLNFENNRNCNRNWFLCNRPMSDPGSPPNNGHAPVISPQMGCMYIKFILKVEDSQL